MIELTLVRHGKTQANIENRYCGITDEPLCEKGISELKRCVSQGIYEDCSLLFVSPKLRCMQTADILFDSKPQIINEKWSEIDFGLFEGKSFEELSGTSDYQDWINSGGSAPFPGGESRDIFIKRNMDGLKDFFDFCSLRLSDYKDINAAAVVHGGTIMALCSSLSGGDYFDYRVKCTEGYKLIFDNMGKLLKEPAKIC